MFFSVLLIFLLEFSSLIFRRKLNATKVAVSMVVMKDIKDTSLAAYYIKIRVKQIKLGNVFYGSNRSLVEIILDFLKLYI
ncbi:hypothetical protein HGG79_11270 [Clostridium tetanomorphum]|uniref:Uncharacterized protein n=1 Tax=Clostridium tetanomorphum TaxID=1553 RepID=A0A923EAY1_CLOTT|nr:hypothetical protein [Clostridium tetanomorphum]